MNEKKIALYIDRYLKKSHALSAVSPEVKHRLHRYVTFFEKADEGYLYRKQGETILDDVEIEMEGDMIVLPAGKLLDCLEFIPDLDEDQP